jgi:uncharacterized membrane protein YraQ (UPF0718 family)
MALCCVVLAAAVRSPEGVPTMFQDAVARSSLGAIWWASIMLASTPFVVAGALAAALTGYLPRLGGHGAALAAMLSPGCDCSLAGFAPALRRSPPAVAGFAIAWGAIAGPSALIATRAAGGDRLLEARVVGACVTAALTALAWGIAKRRDDVPECDASSQHPSIVERVCNAFGGLAACASAAAALLVAAPGLLGGLTNPFVAALIGSLLSPCSTADAVLARVLVHDRASQAAFVIAAQAIDVRQLSTILRVFGWRHALLAALAGAAGCAVAAFAAR